MDGWRIFVAHVLNEWQGKGYHSRMSIAFGGTDNLEPRVLHRASHEILRMLSWPTAEIATLKGSVDDE